MAGQQQQQGGGGGGGGGDNSLDFLWLIVMVIAFIVGAWYFGRVYIVSAIYFVRKFEVMLINFFLEFYGKLAIKFGLPFPDTTDLVVAIGAIHDGPSKTMGFGVVADVSTTVGLYLTIPVAIILVVLAFLVFRSNIGAKFKRIHSMDSLRQSEIKLWHMLEPVNKLKLVDENIDKGPWAMSVSPKMFAEKNDLLIKDFSQAKPVITVRKGSATRVFSLQLKQYFSKIDTLPDHAQAVFAVCAARANRDRKISDSLIEQFSRSAAAGSIDYTGVKEAIAKYINTKEVQYVVQRHGYILTLMASMLELGRADGVLATAEFLWLKPIDRDLWYMLNSVGRQTPFSEVAGAYSHWLVEKKLQRPLKIPMVEQAVISLEDAISEILFDPKDEVEKADE